MTGSMIICIGDVVMSRGVMVVGEVEGVRVFNRYPFVLLYNRT